MISDLYERFDDKIVKKIINVYIGKMEMTNEEINNFYVDRVCNNDEIKRVDGYQVKLFDNYHMNIKHNINYKIHTRKPISIQIKDYSRVVLYKKMLELNLTMDDIIQIKTDAISFYENKTINDLDNGLNGWKEEEFKKISNIEPMYNDINSFDDLKLYSNENIITNAYAGAGKTHHILNNVLPNLPKDDYIVLTPSHSTIEEYRKKNKNCNVIQKYSFQNEIPKEKYIIIDEHGLLDKKANDIIYKCYLDDKVIYSYGDWNQLLPVGEEKHFNSEQYLKMVFNKIEEMNVNHRNDFTKEYYDKIINGKLNPLDEVKKYSTKSWKDAEVIICYFNENNKKNPTAKKYNNLMLNHLGFKDKFQVGVKLICKTNDLRHKNIYNNFIEEITHVDKNLNPNDPTILLSNGEKFSKNEIKKYFSPAYARTAYGIQGKSLKSYYYAPEDYHKIDSRLGYTVVSRLKTK